MFKDLRIGWRQIVADPAYSAVILLGLAVAVACCLLTMQVLFNQILPDPEMPEPSRVVNFEFRGNESNQEDSWFDQAPFVLATALRENHAPLTAITRSLDGHQYVAHVGERQWRLGFEFADPEAIDVFGLRAVAGDLRAAFVRPDAVALTMAAARRVFPAGDALGRTITVKNHVLTVVAITTDRQRGESEWLQDAFVGFDSAINHVDADTRTSWGSIQGEVFARLAPGATAAQLGAAAQSLYDASPQGRHEVQGPAQGKPEDKSPVLRAMPMTDRYLSGGMGGRHRSRQFFALAGAALLTLGLAVANYINLTSVRTLGRAREIAVRKTLGASPWRLTLQFVAESTIAAFAAAAVGLLLAWWLAPALGDLLYLKLAAGLFAPERLALLATAALLLGVLTGLYPARIAHGVDCGTALAGRSHDEGRVGRGLRRAMTALQFVVTLVVSAGAGTMIWQNQYVASLPHGIRTTGLLAVDVPDGYSGKSDGVNAAFAEALLREPGVQKEAWVTDVPGRGQSWVGVELARGNEPPVHASLLAVGIDFFSMFDVPLIAGRLRMPPLPPADAASGAAAGPKPERLIVVDAATSRALGFATPRDAVDQLMLEGDPKSPQGRDPMRIIGVSADVRMEHAHEATRLHAIGLTRKPKETLTLQGPDMRQLQQALEHVWPRFFPEDTLETSTIEEALGIPYLQERRLAQMTLASTLIALLLSAFGVYALAAYTVRRSAREIVVRKLYGASRTRIARLLAGEFVPLLAVAAVVGLPLAAWLTSSWLASFTERSSLVMLALPIALVALVAMTALAALRHGFIAMNMRPTQALRD
jgi:putative ABC transport system permease protein